MTLRDSATIQRIQAILIFEIEDSKSTDIVTHPSFKKIVRHPPSILATCFGVGLLVPRAPGTAGTFVAILPVLAMQSLPWPAQVCVVIVMLIVGVLICGMSARELGEHDPGVIVWDEITGFCIAMTGIPLDITVLILGFLLFRLFDIVKPFPVNWVNANVKGGLGIMGDDVLAGIITNFSLVVFLAWKDFLSIPTIPLF